MTTSFDSDPRTRQSIFAVAIVLVVTATSGKAGDRLQATAETIVSDQFLARPAKLDAPVEFHVAKTAPRVDFARIPLPDTPADPWSIWGYSLLHSNGKFYVPVGDHLGVDSNSYIYEYDPDSKRLRNVGDLQSAVKSFKPGEFGFGKIHGRLNEGADGRIYFPSYWGKWRTENEHFHGDRVFSYDPKTETVTDLGMPAFGWGYPSSHMDAQRGLLYAEAHRRKANSKGDSKDNYLAPGYSSFKDPYQIEFLVYDVQKRKVVFHGGHEGLSYGRDFFVDADGNAYWNNGGGSLQKYNPESNSVSTVKVKMPGEKIRRAVGPDDHGILYGVTPDTRKIFSFDPKAETIRTITTAWADSPGMDVTPNGKYLYFVPGGHGPSSGTPLIQVNLSDGSQNVIAFLHEAVWNEANFNLGGTYSVQVSDDGGMVYVGFNGKDGDQKKAWGHLALVAVHIPSSER